MIEFSVKSILLLIVDLQGFSVYYHLKDYVTEYLCLLRSRSFLIFTHQSFAKFSTNFLSQILFSNMWFKPAFG